MATDSNPERARLVRELRAAQRSINAAEDRVAAALVKRDAAVAGLLALDETMTSIAEHAGVSRQALMKRRDRQM